MDIKDTKEFDEKFGDSFRGGDMNSFESAEPIKEYIIQDRIKLIEEVIEKLDDRMKLPSLEPSDIYESGKLVGRIETLKALQEALSKLKE